jgi:hypothetical protein
MTSSTLSVSKEHHVDEETTGLLSSTDTSSPAGTVEPQEKKGCLSFPTTSTKAGTAALAGVLIIGFIKAVLDSGFEGLSSNFWVKLYNVDGKDVIDDQVLSNLMMIQGIGYIIFPTVVLRGLLYCMDEQTLLVLTLLTAGGYSILTGSGGPEWTVYLSTLLCIASSMSDALFSTVLSKLASEKEQGKVQGVYGSMYDLGSVLGNLVYGVMVSRKQIIPLPFLSN